MKRNKSMRVLTIGLLTVSAFALGGCIEDEAETATFPDLSSCLSAAANNLDGSLTPDMCSQAQVNAETIYADAAPRYDALTLCEEQHGKGACDSEVRSDGTSVFLPLMAGFMVGRMMSGSGAGSNIGASSCTPNTNDPDCRRRGGAFVYSPIYRAAGGGYASTNGDRLSTNYAPRPTARPVSTFSKPTSTARAAPMTTASVKASGGFGAARSGGSFGG